MKKFAIIFSFLSIFLVGCNDINSNQTNNTLGNNVSTKRLSAENPASSDTQDSKEEQIATFSTSIRPNEPSRQKNIKLGCQELNGTIVKAGETFSFCDTLGPATPEKGYEKAETFDNKGEDYNGIWWREMPN